MRALSQSGHSKAPEKILQMLVEIAEAWSASNRAFSGDIEEPAAVVAPTLSMFHTAMGALAKSATHYNQRSLRESAQQIDDLLHLILDKQTSWGLQPSLRTYLIALGAWERVEKLERTGVASARAEAILDQMVAPFCSDANNGQRRSQHHKNASNHHAVHPNAQCFATVMMSWMNAGHPEKAEDLYHRLISLYKHTRASIVLPNISIANMVLTGWAKAEKPEKILQLMMVMQELAADTKKPNVQLNINTFNILLSVYGKLGQGDEALELLSWMEDHDNKLQQNPDHKFAPLFRCVVSLEKPDNISYCNVIRAVGKDHKPIEESEGILQRMKQSGVLPNRVTYTALIHNYATAKHQGKVSRAHALLKECATNETPDIALLVAFLQVCGHATSSERSQAIKLAVQVYESIDPAARNAMAYWTMAKAINHLVRWDMNRPEMDSDQVDNDRVRMLQVVARHCCESGHLSGAIRDQLERRSSSKRDTVASWLGSSKLQVEWSRNVPRKDRPTDLHWPAINR